MTRLNWAILGPGTIANEFAKAIIEVNGSITAVGARNLEKAQKFASTYNIPKIYDHYEKMLQDDEIDIVYISTPHNSHYEFIMECLKNNKHVLCEKAITVNGKQLRDINELAKKKNLMVAEAMTIYHMPLYKKLRQIINSGQLGNIKMIQVSFGSFKEYDPSSRFFNPELAGGALLDIGTYALSFVRYFLSQQPNEILTTVKPFETGVDEQSGIVLKNQADEMAVVSLTMRAKMPKRGIVACDNGYITIDNFPRASKASITYTEDNRVEVIEFGETEKALHYEVEYMNNIILKSAENDTFDLSIDVMEIMDKVRDQWGI